MAVLSHMTSHALWFFSFFLFFWVRFNFKIPYRDVGQDPPRYNSTIGGHMSVWQWMAWKLWGHVPLLRKNLFNCYLRWREAVTTFSSRVGSMFTLSSKKDRNIFLFCLFFFLPIWMFVLRPFYVSMCCISKCKACKSPTSSAGGAVNAHVITHVTDDLASLIVHWHF